MRLIHLDRLRAIVVNVDASRSIEPERRRARKCAGRFLRNRDRRQEPVARPEDEYRRLAAIEHIDLAERVVGDVDRIVELVAGAFLRDLPEHLAVAIDDDDALGLAIDHRHVVQVVEREALGIDADELVHEGAVGREAQHLLALAIGHQAHAARHRQRRGNVLDRLRLVLHRNPDRRHLAALDDERVLARQDQTSALVEEERRRLLGGDRAHELSSRVVDGDTQLVTEQQLAGRIEVDPNDVLELRVLGARISSVESVGRLRGRAHVQTVQNRVQVERLGSFERFGQLLANALELLERARRAVAGDETHPGAEAGAGGPARSRILHRHAAKTVERFFRAPDHAQRIAGVKARGRHCFVIGEQTRHALEARQRGVDVGRRAALRQRDASRDDVGHRRRVGVGIILQQPLDRRLGRGGVVRNLELIERDLQQRVVGDRALPERVEDRLKILQRLGIAAILHEREAALVLPPRELLGVALCAEDDGAGRHDGGDAKTERPLHCRMTRAFCAPGATLMNCDLVCPFGHTRST